jgi:AbrB family looped-hinge helix DNA binding protein
MSTRVTVKGQVTLPKSVRDAVGIKAGDLVDVRATAAGGVIIEKPGAGAEYRARAIEVAQRGLVAGMTTDAFMELSRGEVEPSRRKGR